MSVQPPYAWQHVFGDLGMVVRVCNRCLVAAANLDGDKTAVEGQLDDDAADLNYLAELLVGMVSAETACDSSAQSLAEHAKSYIRTLGKTKLGATATALADLLADLAAKFTADSQTLDANAMGVLPWYTIINDGGNQLGDLTGVLGLNSAATEQSAAGPPTYWVWYVDIIDDGGGFRHIDIYNDVAKGGGDLVAHTATYNTIGAKALVEDNASGLGGSVMVDVVGAADADIQVKWYMGSTRTGDGHLAGWQATQMAQPDDLRLVCTSNAGGPGAETWQLHSARLGSVGTGFLTGVAYPGSQDDKVGVSFTVTAGGGVAFVQGDEFKLAMTSDDVGVFQTFFRDYLGVVLDADSSGGESIDDALAEP